MKEGMNKGIILNVQSFCQIEVCLQLNIQDNTSKKLKKQFVTMVSGALKFNGIFSPLERTLLSG